MKIPIQEDNLEKLAVADTILRLIFGCLKHLCDLPGHNLQQPHLQQSAEAASAELVMAKEELVWPE